MKAKDYAVLSHAVENSLLKTERDRYASIVRMQVGLHRDIAALLKEVE